MWRGANASKRAHQTNGISGVRPIVCLLQQPPRFTNQRRIECDWKGNELLLREPRASFFWLKKRFISPFFFFFAILLSLVLLLLFCSVYIRKLFFFLRLRPDFFLHPLISPVTSTCINRYDYVIDRMYIKKRKKEIIDLYVYVQYMWRRRIERELINCLLLHGIIILSLSYYSYFVNTFSAI